MDLITAAVIGLGRMGAELSSRMDGKIPAGWLPISHAEAILAIRELRLAALSDTDPGRLRRFMEVYNVRQGFSSYTDLLEQSKPTFLTVATRTPGRVEIIRSAAACGCKMIYVEKPLANSLLSASQAIEAIKEHEVILGYGVNRRYHSVYRWAKQMLEEETYGSLVEICVEHGRSNLYWTHPHSTDIILFFAGNTDVKTISAIASFSDVLAPGTLKIDDDPVVEHAIFIFGNGIKATITNGTGWNVRLHCTKGIITVCADGSWVEVNELASTGYLKKAMQVPVEIKDSATVTAFRQLISCYCNKSEPAITLDEIYTGLCMLNGIVYSALNGGMCVQPAQVPEELFITGRSGSYYA